VVVGDVDHKAVFKLAQQHYGKLAARPLPARKPQGEPEQLGIKRLVVKAPAELPVVSMAWRVPRLKDAAKDRDPYALDVLAAVLDGHASSRLERNLVRSAQIAQSVGAGYDAINRGEALFTLEGTPASGKTVADMEAALRSEIERIQRDGVTAEELERVKTQIVARQVYKRDSLFGQAMEIGQLEVTGFSWRDIDPNIEKLKTVTAEEVQAVARKYFKDDALTVAVLEPQPLGSAPQRKPAGLRH
jgi:zinc protease